MRETQDNPSPIRQFGEAFTRYRDLLFLGPIALYVLGFLIVNLHLGSLGIVNFDLFRARYIVVGAMFLAFFITLVEMLRRLFHKLMKDEVLWKRILDGFTHSLSIYGLLVLIVALFTSFSGESSAPAVWLEGLSPLDSPLRWAVGDSNAPIQRTATVMAVILGLYLVGVVLFLIKPPRTEEGIRRSRREVLRGAAIGFAAIVGIFAFIVILGGGSRYLSALTSARSIGAPRQSLANWGPFVTLHLVVYLICAVVILALVIMREEGQKSGSNDLKEAKRESGFSIPGLPIPLDLLLVGLAILLPIYALGAYPGIPQQVGGGAVIPASVTVSSKDFEHIPEYCQSPMFLVDRTPRTTILVFLERPVEILRTVEVSNSDILAIEYYPDCQ